MKTKSRQQWKPITLRAPVLLSFTGVSLVFIVILELLSYKCRQDGGISFADRNGSFAGGTSFAYLYLPTILAVFYSMIWSWVDLDAKRLESYFQMSRSEGASAKDSILLQYPFEYVAFAPLRAFRRGHWSVVFAGTAMVAIFWAITPLQSAIFTTSTIHRNITTIIDTTASLQPLSDQVSGLTTEFMLTAYQTLWLGQELPAFTTKAGALLPFASREVQPNFLANETLTATTSFYSTTLACEPAVVDDTGGGGFTFDNRMGCHTHPITLSDGYHEFDAFCIGYYDDLRKRLGLSTLGCNGNFSNEYLAVWGENSLEDKAPINITALFCRPNYWTQTVDATVVVPKMAVSSITPLGPLLPLTGEVFNISDFEYIINTGSSPVVDDADITKVGYLEQWPRLQHMNLNQPPTNMVGFAIGASKLPSAEYMNGDTLASSLESAYKLLFALAVKNVLTTNISGAVSRPGTREGTTEAVVIIRTLAILVETFLGLVAALAAALLYVSWSRPCQLWFDPASIKDTISIVARNSVLLKEFNNADVINDIDLSVKLDQHQRYHLNDGHCSTELKGPSGINRSVESQNMSGKAQSKDDKKRETIRPVELSFTVGAALLTVLCLITATLTALRIITRKLNGLPLPSNNAIVLQLLLNYIPTAFATFLEPFWVLLNRLLCMLQPFEELRKGQAYASVSLSVKYTSLPPQLVLWRALRARHIRLAAVCSTAISANVLAVAFSALFETKTINLPLIAEVTMPYLPQINNTLVGFFPGDIGVFENYLDHFYVASSNISNGTALPPWVTKSMSFLPFGLGNTSSLKGVQNYKAVTRGFGLDLECTELSPTGANNTCTTLFGVGYEDTGQATITISILDAHGQQVNCTTSQNIHGDPNGTRAAEFILTFDYDPSGFCREIFLVGFVRANTNLIPSKQLSYQNASIQSSSSLWMSCQPRLITAQFSVTVSPSGQIISTTQLHPYVPISNLSTFFTDSYMDATLTSLYFNTNLVMRMIIAFPGFNNTLVLENVGPTGKAFWHNDTFARTWFTYLMKTSANSTAFLDAYAPAPSFEPTAQLVSDLYTRLAAIMFGLNVDYFFMPASPPPLIQGTVTISTRRLFISPTMFIISITLLTLNIVVAFWYYVCRPKRFLPRMPTSIASLVAMFPASHLVQELVGRGGRDEREEAGGWEGKGWRFGYGRYVGTDGKPHVGIERKPFVVPLNEE